MKYKRDFLDTVVARIDFDAPLPIAKEGPPKSVYASLKARFPITEEKKIVGKELIVSVDAMKERPLESTEWHYYGKDRQKQLNIGPAAMYVKYTKYEYYEKLHDDFLSVSDALFDAYPKLQVKRLGLRYIDNITIDEGHPMEWDKYLRPELNSIFSLAEDKSCVSRAFHVLEFNYGEDSLRFQFGMFNPDYPSPIKQKLYVFDSDMYTSKILDKADIEPILNRFHLKLKETFESMITDELRKIMEPVDAG